MTFFSSGRWLILKAGEDSIFLELVKIRNNKWIGTRNNGLCKFNGSIWTIYNTINSSLPSNVIYSLEADQAGNIWLGTALGGLAKFNGSSWTTYNTGNSVLPSNNIYSLKYNTVTNRLWVGTDAGIGVLSGTNWTIYSTSNCGLASNYVRGISFAYATGETWMATGYNGISRFDGTTWQTYNTSNSNIPVNGIWSIVVTNNTSPGYEVWASTWGGGIIHYGCQQTALTLAAPPIICSGNSVSITASGANNSVSWYASATSTQAIGSGSLFSSPILTAAISPTAYTYYASANSCASNTSAPVSITVNPLPGLTVSSTSNIICRGQATTLTAMGASTYSWNQLSVIVSTNQAFAVAPSVSTVYNVTGTNIYGCSQSAAFTVSVFTCLGIANESYEKNDFSIFPNPSSGNFSVKCNFQPGNEYQLVIEDIKGSLLKTYELNTASFQVSDAYSPGIYFCKLVKDNRAILTKKIVIVN